MASKDDAKKTTEAGTAPITREDVEAKVRHLTGDVNEQVEKMTRAGAAVGAGLLMLLLIIVFLMGRGKGKKKTTVVEVIRI